MAYDLWQSCVLVPGFSRSECASWVQAWGSIGAILMAAWGVHRAHQLQIAHKKSEEAAEYTRFLETLFQLLGVTRQIADKIVRLEGGPGAGSSPDDRRTMLAELSALADALKRMDLARLDRYDYVESWLVGDALTRKLIDAVKLVDAPGKVSQLEQANLSFIAERVVETLDERGKRIYKAIEERGGPPGAEPMPKGWMKRPPSDH